MGGKDRAAILSEKLGMSKAVKGWLRFLLEKCGNCHLRIYCWAKMIPDMGILIEQYREVFLCREQSCFPNHVYIKSTFDGKQVVKFIKNCDGCQYLVHCISNILQSREFMGMLQATSNDADEHVAAIKRCAECPVNELCWSSISRNIGIGWKSSPKVLKIMMECKYKWKVEKMEQGAEGHIKPKSDEELQKEWDRLNGSEFCGMTYNEFKQMINEASDELAKKDNEFRKFIGRD